MTTGTNFINGGSSGLVRGCHFKPHWARLFQNVGNFVYPHFPCAFGEDTKKPSVPSIQCLCGRNENIPRRVIMCNLSWTHILEKGNSEIKHSSELEICGILVVNATMFLIRSLKMYIQFCYHKISFATWS